MELKYYNNKITENQTEIENAPRKREKNDFYLTLTVTFPSEMLLPNGIR